MPVCQMNDDRQIAVESRLEAKTPQTPFLNSDVSEPVFTKFLHNVAKSSPCDLFKAA